MSTSKPLILVTGAAGVMGARLAARLLAQGCRVRGVVLPNDAQAARIAQLGCELFEADISEPSSLRGACDGVACVYHLAAVIISHDPDVFTRVNWKGTDHVVAEADAAGVPHLIYVSSASVTYPKLTPYAQSKLQAEHVVAARRGAYTIVRPTLVYDERGGQELRMFLDYLQRFPIVPFIGPGDAIKRPVWSEDIVTGLSLLADNPVAFGKTYNFSGAEPISMRDFARLLLAHHRASRPFVHLPVPFCRALARVLARLTPRPPLTLSAIAGIVHDADLDPSEATRDLGYRPIGVREGFARCFPLAHAGPALQSLGNGNTNV